MIDRPIIDEDGKTIGHFNMYETWEDFETEMNSIMKMGSTK